MSVAHDYLKYPRSWVRPLFLILDRMFSRTHGKILKEKPEWTLYHYESCVFCFRVRRALEFAGYKIKMKDVDLDSWAVNELTQQGGKLQVPCLRVTRPDGAVEWIYESGKIVQLVTS